MNRCQTNPNENFPYFAIENASNREGKYCLFATFSWSIHLLVQYLWRCLRLCFMVYYAFPLMSVCHLLKVFGMYVPYVFTEEIFTLRLSSYQT